MAIFSIYRAVLKTLNSVKEPQNKQLALSQMAEISSQQTATSNSSMRTKFGIRENQNCLLDLSVDLFKY